MKYKTYKGQKDIKLLYFVAIVTLFALLSVIYIFMLPTRQLTWQDYATYNFDATIETDEEGQTYLAVDISTPEQLAGIFSDREKTYNLYTKSKNETNTRSNKKTYQIKNQSMSAISSFLSSTYADYTTDSKYSEKVFRLTNDINLGNSSWLPSRLNSGYTFDGQNYTISNLKIYNIVTITNVTNNGQSEKIPCSGFIGLNFGTIKNVSFENVKIETKGIGNVGTVCAVNAKKENDDFGTVKSCIVKSGNITYTGTATGDCEIGGICGKNLGKISQCINRATVSSGKHIGGIVGLQTDGSVKSCFNYGSVSTSMNTYLRCGGIIGEAQGGTISACRNSGTITASNSGEYNVAVGGIIGFSKISISECENKGSISAGNEDTSIAYAGGISGYFNNDNKKLKMLACKNIGSIYAESKSSSTEENLINFKDFTFDKFNNGGFDYYANDIISNMTFIYKGASKWETWKDWNKEKWEYASGKKALPAPYPQLVNYNLNADGKEPESIKKYTYNNNYAGKLIGFSGKCIIENCISKGYSQSLRFTTKYGYYLVKDIIWSKYDYKYGWATYKYGAYMYSIILYQNFSYNSYLKGSIIGGGDINGISCNKLFYSEGSYAGYKFNNEQTNNIIKYKLDYYMYPTSISINLDGNVINQDGYKGTGLYVPYRTRNSTGIVETQLSIANLTSIIDKKEEDINYLSGTYNCKEQYWRKNNNNIIYNYIDNKDNKTVITFDQNTIDGNYIVPMAYKNSSGEIKPVVKIKNNSTNISCTNYGTYKETITISDLSNDYWFTDSKSNLQLKCFYWGQNTEVFNLK